MSLPSRSFALTGGVALLTVGLATAVQVLPAAVASVGHEATAKPAPTNGWKQVSTHSQSIISRSSVLPLATGGVQVVWQQTDGSSSQSIRARVISERGKMGSPVATVVSGWATLNSDPDIIANGTDRLVAFSGQHSTGGSDPLNVGSVLYATSANGSSWSIGPGSLSQATTTGSYGTGAVDDAGMPLIGTTVSSTDHLTFHRGISPARPASSADWTGKLGNGCCAYDPSLARDTKSGDIWSAWYSNASKKSVNGVIAEQAYPTPVGKQFQAPGSFSNGSSLEPGQPVALASRNGGGVYAAYLAQYPTANRIGIWRVGAKQHFFIKTKNTSRVMLTTGPHGTLWVAWYDAGTYRVHYARTNQAVTRIGDVGTLKPPGKSGSSLWSLDGAGPVGSLHLVINANGGFAKPQFWYHKVLAGLTLVATPRTLNKGVVKATVTDAGKPVAGAKVHFGKASKPTNAKGIATFKVKPSYPSGKVHLRATKNGYAPGVAPINVT